MITMTCDRCGEARPLEEFDTGLMRAPLYSHELQFLDRVRREPEQVCRGCFRGPGPLAGAVDRALDDTREVTYTFDVLADVYDGLRRRLRRERP
jgi:hypothetical protein